jgi:hypothetical protein
MNLTCVDAAIICQRYLMSLQDKFATFTRFEIQQTWEIHGSPDGRMGGLQFGFVNRHSPEIHIHGVSGGMVEIDVVPLPPHPVQMRAIATEGTPLEDLLADLREFFEMATGIMTGPQNAPPSTRAERDSRQGRPSRQTVGHST